MEQADCGMWQNQPGLCVAPAGCLYNKGHILSYAPIGLASGRCMPDKTRPLQTGSDRHPDMLAVGAGGLAGGFADEFFLCMPSCPPLPGIAHPKTCKVGE